MKAGWEIKTLNQISTNLDSKRVPITKSERKSGVYPYYGASGIVDYVDDYIFDEDALLISEDGANLLARSTPIAFPATGKYWVNNHAHIVSFESMTTQRFVELYLDSIPLDDYITGAAQPKLNQKALNSIPILVPPLSEQQRIVAILDEAFEVIATARANAEQNRQNARALFEGYLQSVFNQRGEGWIETTIGDICTLKSGTSVNVSLEKPTGDLAYVKVSDMSHAGNETEIYSSSRFLNMCDVGKNAIFPVGTTIFPKRGGAILTNKKRLTAVPICADLNIMGVIPPDSLSSQLLYYYFLNVDMKRLGSGSSIPQINNYDIAPLMLSFPENKEQQYKLVKNIDALHKETQRLESLYQRKIAALDELKQSLLQQAFSGQL